MWGSLFYNKAYPTYRWTGLDSRGQVVADKTLTLGGQRAADSTNVSNAAYRGIFAFNNLLNGIVCPSDKAN